MATLIVNNNGCSEFNADLEHQVIQYLKNTRTAKDRYNKVRRAIKKEMITNDLKSIESEYLSLAYSPKSYRVTFDVNRFREDYPELYEEYMRTTPVKDSVKIVLKKPKADSRENGAS